MPVPGLYPGIVAGIHVFLEGPPQDVDGRDKPGHDSAEAASSPHLFGDLDDEPQLCPLLVLGQDVAVLG
jgi:hypothetical protein